VTAGTPGAPPAERCAAGPAPEPRAADRRLPAEHRPTVVVTGTVSDAHTWNLVFLQLFIEELGYDVVNLGSCVPEELLVAECRRIEPALIVVSSVNGHGFRDGLRAAASLRACPELAGTPAVIGGKLGIGGGSGAERLEALVAAGFDAVFEDGTDLEKFRAFVEYLPGSQLPALPAGRDGGAA